MNRTVPVLDRRLYKVKECLYLLNISNTKFYTLVKEKLLKTIKLGRSTYVDVEELQRFLKTLVEANEGSSK
ncbi:excisionase family DNA binding protein [Rhodoligotrophos appendicifer]|uniref:helix-turn-helix domain-containing protein n=1 Tax=Rhodoligotrophos appendicifer TaxID=987056 RepID=UPI00118598A4